MDKLKVSTFLCTQAPLETERFNMAQDWVSFGVIRVDHNHACRIVENMNANSGVLKSWWARAELGSFGSTSRMFPDAVRVPFWPMYVMELRS